MLTIHERAVVYVFLYESSGFVAKVCSIVAAQSHARKLVRAVPVNSFVGTSNTCRT